MFFIVMYIVVDGVLSVKDGGWREVRLSDLIIRGVAVWVLVEDCWV